MASAGIPTAQRNDLYTILAAILHLGNIVLEEISESKCKISNSSRDHFENAARLLNIDQHTFETALLTRTLEVKGSEPIV